MEDEKQFETVSIEDIVDRIQLGKGVLVVYKDKHSYLEDDFEWDHVAKIAQYQLAQEGILSYLMTVDEFDIYKSYFEEEDRSVKLQDIEMGPQQKFIYEKFDQDFLLWAPGCFCCIHEESGAEEMYKHKGEIGVLATKAHYEPQRKIYFPGKGRVGEDKLTYIAVD
jgi:hypothetical protein